MTDIPSDDLPVVADTEDEFLTGTLPRALHTPADTAIEDEKPEADWLEQEHPAPLDEDGYDR